MAAKKRAVKSEFEEVKKQLLTKEFTQAELQALAAVVAVRQGQVKQGTKLEHDTADIAEDLSLFYSCLADLVNKKFGERVPSVVTLKKVSKRLHENVSACSLALTALLDAHLPNAHRHLRTRFFEMYLLLAYDYLRSHNLEVSTFSLCMLHDRAAGLIDRAFPGYLEARLMETVLLGKLSREI